jgi:uncharacterized protein DUF3352
VKARLVLSVAAVLSAPALAGCGGDSGTGADDPASLAPAGTPIYIQGVLRPQGQLRSDVETLASTVSGLPDPIGELIDLLNRSMNEEPNLSGRRLSFAKDIEPWLGERAGVFVEGLEDDPPAAGILQTTDPEAAQAFIDDGRQRGDENRSYKGVDYILDGDSDTAAGMVEDFVVVGSEEAFKGAVDVSEGDDSLSGQDEFTETLDETPEGGLIDVYADIGGLLDQAGTPESDQAVQVFKAIGLDPTDATAVASVVPGADQLEIDVSTDLAEGAAPASAAGLLGSFPAGAFAAFASAGFGEQLQQAIDGLDKSGIPPDVPPNRLKSTLKQAGIDLDRIAGSLDEAGAFAQGMGESSLGGALVLTTDDSSDATNTISNIGLLLRSTGTPGVTAVSGKASGFSIRSPDLGRKPVVVVAKDNRIAVAYGLDAALQGVSAGSGATLAESAAYKAGVDSLGATPISGFVDGPGVLGLVEGLGAVSDPDFQSARPYLAKVDFLAAGTGAEDDLTTTKLIVGFGK